MEAVTEMPADVEKCDCAQKLDKLRMDLEAGKDVSFVCYVFQSGEIGEQQFPIRHRATVEMLYTVAFDTLRAANRRLDAMEEREG
jgi:hypothetical protein